MGIEGDQEVGKEGHEDPEVDHLVEKDVADHGHMKGDVEDDLAPEKPEDEILRKEEKEETWEQNSSALNKNHKNTMISFHLKCFPKLNMNLRIWRKGSMAMMATINSRMATLNNDYYNYILLMMHSCVNIYSSYL